MTSYDDLPDSDLTERLRLGDSAAFAEVYERFFVVLYKHALNRLRDEEQAKDIVQELFEDLWSKKASLFIQSNLSNYLYTAIRNKVLKVIAHQNVVSAYAAKQVAFLKPDEGLTDHRVRERQLAAIIEKEVQSLPPKMKAVFELSRKHNYTHKEIAEQMDITEQSVRSHIKNALKILKIKFRLVYYMLMIFW
ncbi:RNA polymerase sigma factor [Pedobacter caeni]|uniref:RNA polymerase sigma-70 factor, Bacteroides expansion family 1 n=1 Tax=Pedobacter caeni TaxID=288992 RepID=A0A1M5HLI9_9SPHI|nr:RNA polymerase sigma-70 factor [Pedobacter caeni]SHG16712.1 RNA polymerase sigma-70 factor, Bacteroides expansion family 1 [Pedobacter caeni]